MENTVTLFFFCNSLSCMPVLTYFLSCRNSEQVVVFLSVSRFQTHTGIGLILLSTSRSSSLHYCVVAHPLLLHTAILGVRVCYLSFVFSSVAATFATRHLSFIFSSATATFHNYRCRSALRLLLRCCLRCCLISWPLHQNSLISWPWLQNSLLREVPTFITLMHVRDISDLAILVSSPNFLFMRSTTCHLCLVFVWVVSRWYI